MSLTALAIQSTKAVGFVQQGTLTQADFSIVATLGVVMAFGSLPAKSLLAKTESRTFEVIVDCLSVVAGIWLVISELFHLH